MISDGVNNKAGSFFTSYEFFYAWRKIEGQVNEVNGIDSLYTLIQGMLNKYRLRDIIHNFIFIPDSSKKDEKIVCRYPQYYAANKLSFWLNLINLQNTEAITNLYSNFVLVHCKRTDRKSCMQRLRNEISRRRC